jgi:hypothetical protein
LFVVTIASVGGVLWLIGTPVLGLRGVPDVAELPDHDGEPPAGHSIHEPPTAI